MTIERWLRLLAGGVVTASIALGLLVHQNFLWVALIVGVSLFQSGITNWCPMMSILKRSCIR